MRTISVLFVLLLLEACASVPGGEVAFTSVGVEPSAVPRLSEEKAELVKKGAMECMAFNAHNMDIGYVLQGSSAEKIKIAKDALYRLVANVVEVVCFNEALRQAELRTQASASMFMTADQGEAARQFTIAPPILPGSPIVLPPDQERMIDSFHKGAATTDTEMCWIRITVGYPDVRESIVENKTAMEGALLGCYHASIMRQHSNALATPNLIETCAAKARSWLEPGSNPDADVSQAITAGCAEGLTM